jgi:hypothetical protein
LAVEFGEGRGQGLRRRAGDGGHSLFSVAKEQ